MLVWFEAALHVCMRAQHATLNQNNALDAGMVRSCSPCVHARATRDSQSKQRTRCWYGSKLLSMCACARNTRLSIKTTHSMLVWFEAALHVCMRAQHATLNQNNALDAGMVRSCSPCVHARATRDS